jgi:hypothetical protein
LKVEPGHKIPHLLLPKMLSHPAPEGMLGRNVLLNPQPEADFLIVDTILREVYKNDCVQDRFDQEICFWKARERVGRRR